MCGRLERVSALLFEASADAAAAKLAKETALEANIHMSSATARVRSADRSSRFQKRWNVSLKCK